MSSSSSSAALIAVRAIVHVVGISSLLVYPISFALSYKLRKHRLVRGRGGIIAIWITHGAIFVYEMNAWITRTFFHDNVHCPTFVWLTALTLNKTLLILALQASRLFVIFNLTQELKQCSDFETRDVSEVPWFLKHRRFWTPRFAWCCFLLDTILVCLPIVYANLKNDDLNDFMDLNECNAHQIYRFSLLSVSFTGVLIAIQCIILSRKLTIVVDSLGLKKATKVEGRIGGAICLLVVAGAAIKNNADLKTTYQGSVVMAGFFMITVCGTFVPLLKLARGDTSAKSGLDDADTSVAEWSSRRGDGRDGSRSSGAAKLHELNLFLLNKRGYTKFEAFVSLELSVENLLFWKHVTEFRALKSLDELSLAAMNIYRHFFMDDSPLQINVSDGLIVHYREEYEARQGLVAAQIGGANAGKVAVQVTPESQPLDHSKLEPITKTYFDDALREIMQLMYTDTLRRFKVSPYAFVYTIVIHVHPVK